MNMMYPMIRREILLPSSLSKYNRRLDLHNTVEEQAASERLQFCSFTNPMLIPMVADVKGILTSVA
jgi:hypothetical protein